MPLALLLLLGGGALVGAAYLLGRQSSTFNIADCIEKYTEMGYTSKKALELCEKDYELHKADSDYVGKILVYAVPAGILVGGAYWIYKSAQQKNEKSATVRVKKVISEEGEKSYGNFTPPHPICRR